MLSTLFIVYTQFGVLRGSRVSDCCLFLWRVISFGLALAAAAVFDYGIALKVLQAPLGRVAPWDSTH